MKIEKLIEQMDVIRAAILGVPEVCPIGISCDMLGPRVHVWDLGPVLEVAVGVKPTAKVVGMDLHRSVAHAGVTWSACQQLTAADIDRLIEGRV